LRSIAPRDEKRVAGMTAAFFLVLGITAGVNFAMVRVVQWSGGYCHNR